MRKLSIELSLHIADAEERRDPLVSGWFVELIARQGCEPVLWCKIGWNPRMDWSPYLKNHRWRVAMRLRNAGIRSLWWDLWIKTKKAHQANAVA